MNKVSERYLVICACAICLLVVSPLFAQQASSSQGLVATGAVVPRLVRFSGVVMEESGSARTGATGVRFALYEDQTGVAALWQETQNVALDAQGRYSVLLGASSAEGMPAEVFSSNQARWLGIQPEGQAEQRVLLVSVPYALKAADAETLGGMPASAFVLATPPANAGSGSSVSQSGGTSTGSTTATTGTSASGITPNSTCTSGSCAVSTNAPGGTANFVPLFTDPTTVQNSVLSQAPCPFDSTQTCVGITNTNPPTSSFTPSTSPTRILDVNGEVRVGGGNIFLQRNLSDLTGRRNWAMGTETFNVGDFSIFVSASNSTFPSLPVFTALSNGWMGIGVGTPHANLEIAGSGSGLLVDSPGYISGSGAGLTNLPAAAVTGMLPASALSNVNGSGLTNLTAANLTGTIPVASLPTGVALVSAANMFTASQSIAVPGTGATALSVQATDTTTGNMAVSALADGLNGAAVVGEADSGGLAYGVWGISSTTTGGFAGQFSGNVNVTGSLTASLKNFKIDDPLDPANKYLYHASVESSEMMNIYTGNVVLDASGAAVVQLPNWFEALNTDFRYQLTAVGGPGPGLYVAQEIQNSSFRIAGGAPGLKVSWQVTGVRQDAFAKANPLVVEVQKSERERGYYIQPQLFGQPATKSIDWARRSQQ